MKNGKRPTVLQARSIERAGLNSEDWLVVRQLTKIGSIEICHRDKGKYPETREVKLLARW